MKLLVKALPYIAVVAVAGGIAFGLYSFGSKNGEAKIQKKWDTAEATHAENIRLLKASYDKREEEHREKNRTISFQLGEQKTQHATAMADVVRRYEQRLHNSTKRSEIYQRQAQAGEAECRNLASHAAQFDASLERGRRVVEQLTTTLRLRDQQLILLGEKIMSDYELQKD